MIHASPNLNECLANLNDHGIRYIGYCATSIVIKMLSILYLNICSTHSNVKNLIAQGMLYKSSWKYLLVDNDAIQINGNWIDHKFQIQLWCTLAVFVSEKCFTPLAHVKLLPVVNVFSPCIYQISSYIARGASACIFLERHALQPRTAKGNGSDFRNTF